MEDKIKVALTGDKIRIGDIVRDVWWFPDNTGEVVSLIPYTNSLLYFAGAGSQVATIKGTDRKLTLPSINWYIVERPR